MVEDFLGIISGLTIVVFSVVLIYSFLLEQSNKRRGIHWLNIMSIGFISMAIGEFVYFIGKSDPENRLLSLIDSAYTLNLFIDVFSLVAVFGLMMFLLHVKNNMAEFR